MAAAETFAGRAPREGIGARVREGLRTVFPQRRVPPIYSSEAVMEALGPHVHTGSSFAQEMTDYRQGSPPELSDVTKGTLVKLGFTAGITGIIFLATGCGPDLSGGIGHVPTDGGAGQTPDDFGGQVANCIKDHTPPVQHTDVPNPAPGVQPALQDACETAVMNGTYPSIPQS